MAKLNVLLKELNISPEDANIIQESSKKENKTNFFISHNDLDGVTACALLQFLLGSNQDNKQYFVEPDDVTSKVKDIMSVAGQNDSLYIIDMAPDDSILPSIDLNFKSWRIYDHYSSRSLYSKAFKSHIISSGNTDVSATLLVWRDRANFPYENKLLHNKKMYKHLKTCVKYVNDYDTWEWQLNKSYPKADYHNVEMLDLLFWFYPAKMRLEFIKKELILSTNFLSNPQNKMLYEILKQNKKDYIDDKIAQAQPSTIAFNGKSYPIVVVAAEQYVSELGNKLIKKWGVPISIIISGKSVSLRGDANNVNINVGKIAKQYFHGGGGEKAAGGTLYYADNSIKKALLDYFSS